MVPTAKFGSTGHHSSRVIFGAAALGTMSQDRADAILATLAPAGINHIDTAASYGESELRLAPFLADHRADFFLATKTGDRTGDAARASLEQSLGRLGVDRVDLIQLHNLVEPEEWATAHGPGGALEALVEARDHGLCRFIGITGHGTRIPAAHLRSLNEFDYDSVLFPYNYTMMANPDYRADAEALINRCVERGVAIQTIKSLARRRWPDLGPDAAPDPRLSWYQPIEQPDAIGRAVNWVLSQPNLFLNSSSDARLLGPTVEAATQLSDRPSDQEMDADTATLGVTALFDGGALERI